MKQRKPSALGILTLLVIITLGNGYKPVVLMHGILSDAASMLVIAEEIKIVSKTIFLKFDAFCFEKVTKNEYFSIIPAPPFTC